ncbi:MULTISPECIES: response regulator [unclassified Anabaena]|uniref:response regulator n=1 Tax=unclassified Anabaena TaxID=2619674 RepID=UPI001448487D|nr:MULTISPECIES: response regulator [unclassified Anabaena]MTJ10035.1 response regulator [Anabaena sp. UHCC 0204]MTJ53542.1 response regulator [Anabaena sp. UHCC 0253]
MAQSPTLLIIEDNQDDLELTLLAFEQTELKANIIIARDGVEAINYFLSPNQALAPLPDLILLDLQMPRLNGLEVIREIRANPRTKLLPIVILTTSHEESDRLQGYGLGCNSYIRKPVEYSEFVNVMKQLGIYWLVLNSPPPFST